MNLKELIEKWETIRDSAKAELDDLPIDPEVPQSEYDQAAQIVDDLKQLESSWVPASLEADKARLDWLESHPLKAEIRGGSDDGHQGKAWEKL